MAFKKHFKSVVCLLMTMLMLFSVVIGVSAAEEELVSTGASGTVYYENNTNWSSVYCYMWNGSGDQKNAEWPGQPMNKVSGNVWSYTTTTDYQNVIFNNGSGGTGNQTADLTFPGSGQIYNGSSWSQYTEPESSSSTEDSSSDTPTPTPGGDGDYIYCENAAGWGSVYCYMWKDGAGDNQAWPGKAMENIGDNIWRYEVTGNFNMIIFNGGSDSQKTSDMQYPGGNYIYNNQTNEWKPFDTSPITVKNFAIDVEGTVYKNMDITVSANASSKGGAVAYKFSVTNGSSTTTLKNFSTANTAKWTPTATGTYTITADFKDAAGNTNQRTLKVTVADDSGIAEPIIKKVTPAAGEVKNNTNMNIAVTGGGGKVGTNLLFYKYTIKDANGKVINVPYYSKLGSYTFKPTALGNFTVTVSVQNSHNSIIERTFTYNSVVNPTTPTESTSEKPTTNPGPSTILGDVDGDGILSVMDATRIQRYNAQLITSADLNLKLGDFDNDGLVTVIDATKIQQKLAGM